VNSRFKAASHRPAAGSASKPSYAGDQCWRCRVLTVRFPIVNATTRTGKCGSDNRAIQQVGSFEIAAPRGICSSPSEMRLAKTLVAFHLKI
jgi:hypothetical protein